MVTTGGPMSGYADALVLTSPRTFERRAIALPEIGEDDGLLRVEACGLCGTDHEQYTGHLKIGRAVHGFIPGHEVVGVIEQIGPVASRRWGLQRGDRVAVEVFRSCGGCAPCQAGSYQRCERNGIWTMYGHHDVGVAPGLWGGYASHLYLAPDAMLLPLPSDLDPVIATLFNPIGAGIRWGVDVPGTSAGDVCVVLGPGIRGLSAAAAMKEAGARFVMMVGVRPRDDERLAIAADFGVDVVADAVADDIPALLRSAAGRLADVVLDVTAKAPSAFRLSLLLARTNGTIVVAGTRGSTDPIPDLDLDRIVYKELRILGALGVDRSAYQRALDLLASGRYPFDRLPRRVERLGDAEDLIRTMAGEGAAQAPVHAVVTP